MYFDRKLDRILIGERELPIKIDMYVLEELQEMYEGSLHGFECSLKGIRESVSDTGEIREERVEPSMRALNHVLPLMIREGCEIEGVELNMTDKEIVRNLGISYGQLRRIVIDEFNRCFETPKK